MKILKLIIESKKSDAVQYFTEKYPNSEVLFDELFSFDPTGYKYIDYIKKWLDSYINKYEVHFSTGFRPDELFSWFENLSWFEKNYKRITIDSVEKLFDVAKSNMEPASVLSEISKITEQTKSDINRYSPSILRYLREVVDSNLTKKDLESLAADGSELVFDYKNIAIIQVKTHAASCYYGSESKWCTAQLKDPSYFLKETQDYKLYYIIDRSNYRKKIAVQVPYKQGNRTIVWSSDNTKQPLSYLFETYPESEPFFEEILSRGSTLQFLRVALQKKQEFSWSYEFPDPMISSIKNNNIVTIKFTDGYESFFNSLFYEQISEYDMAIIHSLFGQYSDSWDFEDYYSVQQDWDDGYLLNSISEEEIPRFMKIISILYPDEYINAKETELRGEMSGLSVKLRNSFEYSVDSIIENIHSMRNDEMNNNVKSFMEETYCEIFDKFGFKRNGCFYSFDVNISRLIIFLIKYSPKGTILDAMKKYIEVEQIEPPDDLTDIAYLGRYNTDSNENYVHNTWSQLLDKIEETIEENLEDPEQTIEDFQEKILFIDKLLKKYEINRFYEIPSGGGKFSVNNWDIIEGVIKLKIRTENGEQLSKTLQFDDFYSFLYNYRLF